MCSDKSYVGMGTTVCPVCYKETDDSVLLDTRMQDSFETGQKYVTNVDLCEDCKAFHDKGYLALLEVSNDRDDMNKLSFKEAKPTGRGAHIKYEQAQKIFSVDIPTKQPLVYLDEEAFNKLFPDFELNLEQLKSEVN